MSKPLNLRAEDNFLKHIPFKPYRYSTEREAIQFIPPNGAPKIIKIATPWGAELEVEVGDYIVNDVGSPDNRWPVKKDIFEETYMELRTGIYIKRALVYLYPLAELTKDPEQLVRVHTLEGVVTVRAGDFYLCKGVRGEIWPMPLDKVETTLIPVKSHD